MNERKVKLSWWWGFIVIGECFIASNTSSTSNHGIRDLPYFEYNFLFVIIAVLMVVLVGTFFQKAINNRNIRFDAVLMLLILRIVLTLIPAVYMKEQYYWGNIACYVVAAIVYLIIINREVYIENILPFVKAFAAVSVLQCIVLFLSSPVPYTDTLYKYYFVSPAGASNFLGCIMVVAFEIIYFTDKGKKKWFWFILGLVGIFLTKSRTSLFTYILVPCMFAFVALVKQGTISVKVLRRTIIVLLTFFVFALVFAGGQIGAIFGELLDSFVRGFTSSGADITSGRVDQFVNQFLNAAKYPLFGAGFTFGDSYGSMHNFILESFYVSGIAGLFIQISLLYNISKYVKGQSKKLGWILIAVFMVSLLEKILFTSIGEFFLWTLVGVIYNEKNRAAKTVISK